MTGINTARVLIGGIVAGLVINIGEFVLNMFVIQKEMEEAVARMNLPPIGGQQIGTFVTLAFVLGIGTVWLYAAIRPRFGAGVGTALCAGAAVWFLAYVYPSVGMVMMGMFPAGTTVLALVWGLVEVLAGAALGAWLYQEQPSGAQARV
jgi:uncharacterized protein YneF (UPF0154 family)